MSSRRQGESALVQSSRTRPTDWSRDSIEIVPNAPKVWATRAHSHWIAGNPRGAVMDFTKALEINGVRRIRLVLMSVGDTEPLVRQAYTEERRKLNRRVELLVTEDLIDDFAGSGSANQNKGSSNG